MEKSNFELLKELKTILQNPKKQVSMSYFDVEDKKLLERIEESEKFSEALSISQEKLNKCYSL